MLRIDFDSFFTKDYLFQLPLKVKATMGEISVFTCTGDEISAKKDLQKKNWSFKIFDAFIFRTQEISDVFHFGRPKYLLMKYLKTT